MGAHVAPTGKNIMWEHTGENILGQKTWSTGGSYREEHHVGTQGRTSLDKGYGAQVAPTGKNIM